MFQSENVFLIGLQRTGILLNISQDGLRRTELDLSPAAAAPRNPFKSNFEGEKLNTARKVGNH